MKKSLSLVLSLVMVCALLVPAASAAGTASVTQQYASFDNQAMNGRWEEAYWAAPVVADLEGDGALDVVTAAYTVTAADAATGKVKWQTARGPAMIFCTPVVADLDGDGKKEVVVGYGEGTISAFSCTGTPLWSQQIIAWVQVRSLAAADVDGDGKQEVIVGLGASGNNHSNSVYVYGCDGQPKPGCISSGAGNYCDGVWCNGISTGDMDGDGLPEIIAPTDNPFINAFNADGSLVMANSDVYRLDDKDQVATEGNIPWCTVSVFEDYEWEKDKGRGNGGWGWGLSMESLAEKGRAGTYAPNNSQAVTRFIDVDGDGKSEIVMGLTMVDRTNYFTASGRDWTTGSKDTKYMTVAIYNQDRTRFNKSGYNWEKIPTDQVSGLGGPLYYDANSFCCNVESVPVVADVNGDGVNEVLFNSLDGKVHCFSLKDSQHELAGWPFQLPQTNASQFEMAGGVACADLNGDGASEVIFGSGLKNSSGTDIGNGTLYVVSGDGKLAASIPLHAGIEEGGVNTPNGTSASVVVQDVDKDGKYEALVNTCKYGLCCYELTMAGGQKPAQPSEPTQPVQPTGVQAIPMNDKLTVDGKSVEPSAYKINGENYFKLRDMAMLLNGTEAQFSVGYDGAVQVGTKQPYKPEGGELAGVPTANASALTSNDAVYIDGTQAQLTVYKIDGVNYFKLRDLGNALGFQVGYDAATKTASITTK